ncbi:MAG: hypothetical protein HGA20_15955, partial [Geobacteraceae bacterium]|nr:hypothetical protein [Geobacteraceae bacterium]
VTGYLITESATPPAASAAGWSAVAPTSFTFSSEGTKTAYAWAKDAAGNVSTGRTASVTITLPDLTAPIVSIPSPISGAIVKGTITVTAGATDNIGVTRVELYVNGNLHASISSAPYSFSWNTAALANGAYNLIAKAYDAAGNIGQSTSVNVTVNNPVADVTPPTITFSSPTSKYVYGSSISISASAADNVAITKMELYVDGVLQLTTSASSINTRVSIAKGLHIILIKAYDAANNVNSSSKTVNRFF